MRTVFWNSDERTVKMIDQRQLPSRLEIAAFADSHGVAQAINEMYVRGAPAIGAAAAFGGSSGKSREGGERVVVG